MDNHWLVINTLVDCLENGIDAEKVKFATLELDMERDRCLVNNLPIEEIERLIAVMKHVNYEFSNNE